MIWQQFGPSCSCAPRLHRPTGWSMERPPHNRSIFSFEPGSRFVPRICSINFSISAGLVFGISFPLPILDPSPSHSRGANYFGQPLPQIAFDWEDSSAVCAFSQLRRLTEGTQSIDFDQFIGAQRSGSPGRRYVLVEAETSVCVGSGATASSAASAIVPASQIHTFVDSAPPIPCPVACASPRRVRSIPPRILRRQPTASPVTRLLAPLQ
jgi:hypothetical protein